MKTLTGDRGSRGQSAVEFALTLPVLFLVIVGVFDFIRAIFHYNTLAEAAREGTRYAMVHGSASGSPVGPGSATYTAPNQDSAVTAQVLSYAVAMDTSQITVLSTWPDGDNVPGHRVQVEMRYSYVPLTSLIVGGASVPMRSVSEASVVY